LEWLPDDDDDLRDDDHRNDDGCKSDDDGCKSDDEARWFASMTATFNSMIVILRSIS